MSGSHSHHRAGDQRRLGWTLSLVLVYLAAEVIGGLMSNSLALLADAGHMLSDAAALGLSLFALRMAARPATSQRTYGFHRAEILAALANGATLVVIAAFIFREAWHRFQAPPEVTAPLMMGVAVGGLLVNVAGLAILHGGRDHSLNLQGAWLHVLSDLLGSVGVLVAGGVIWAFGWRLADPVASALIGFLVLQSAWRLVRDSISVLMEGTPEHLDPADVAGALRDVGGIRDVHDLHLWTITSGFVALSCHVDCDGSASSDTVLATARETVHARFGIDHVTIQVEPPGYDLCDAGNGRPCLP